MSTKPKLRAVLLAAGQGKRMKSSVPKVLHDTLGKTMLSRVLDCVDQLDLEHIHIVAGHKADIVTAYLEKNPPRIPFSIHIQEPQLGTGHALMQVAPALAQFSGQLLVLAADTPLISSQTLQCLLSEHTLKQAAATVLVAKIDAPGSYGRILRDKQGNVCGIVEAKDANDQEILIKEINSAIYCLQWPAMADGLKELKNNNQQKEYYLTDLVGWANKNKLSVASYTTPDASEISGVNSTLELTELMKIMKDKVIRNLALEHGVTIIDPQSTWIAPEVKIGSDTTILPGCYLSGHIEIGSNCQIGPNTFMEGPIKVGNSTRVCQSHITASDIGSNCQIGPFTHLRQGSKISDKVRIGNFVELKQTTVDSSSAISHLSYVGDSTVGKEVNIGAGTITANYDSITKIKSKSIIKNGASTGSNSVLVAPIEVGEEATVAAGSVITQNVPPGALAVGRARQQNLENWVTNKKRKSQKT